MGRILILILLSCLSSCQMSVTLKPTPSALESKTAKIPSDSDSTKTPIPSLTRTVTPFHHLDILSLKPGEYLTFGETIGIGYKFYFNVATLDGYDLGRLAELNGYGSALSPDLHYLLDLPYIIDLETEERTYFDQIDKDCRLPSWSPDSNRIAVMCPTNMGQDDIYIYSMIDHSRIQVTNCKKGALSCGLPSWSPDGNWLAYFRTVGGAGTSELTGLHIINTSCFSEPTSCWNDQAGILAESRYSWSPNGQFLAASDNDIVKIFQVENNNLTLDRSYTVEERVDGIFWLADGNRILVLQGPHGKQGFILNLDTGQLSDLTKEQEIFFQENYHEEISYFSIP